MLETERCRLFIIQESDYEDIKKLYIDANVRKFLGGIVDEKSYNEKFMNMCKSKEDLLYLVARIKDDKQFIGLVSLDLHHDGVNTEISYQFLPKYWGCGYATEIVQQVIDYGFRELGLVKIVAETQTANESSIKLLKRIGMKLEKKTIRFGEEQSIFSVFNTKQLGGAINKIEV